MTDKLRDLESMLSAHQDSAVGALNGTVGQARADLMDRYLGQPYGDEVADRSTIVDTSVRDVVESIKPEIMDIFYGGDRVVEFTPTGDEDEEGAEQETDVCNYMLNQANRGFYIVYNWVTDALLLKTGYVKRYWDRRDVVEVEEYDELTDDELLAILQDLSTADEVEVIERWDNTETQRVPFDGMTELPDGVEVVEGMIEVEVPVSFGVRLRVTRSVDEYKIVNVPPEEVYVAPQWTRLDFDGCPFHAHRSVKTVSELIEMGFDEDEAHSLPETDRILEHEETEARFTGERFQEDDLGSAHTGLMREVVVFENYVYCDYDEDGKAELLQVYTDDKGSILHWADGEPAVEQVGAPRINVLSAIPVPHKHYGLSPGEIVQDLARLKTVLTRQLIDNQVMNNNPDLLVDTNTAEPETYEDLSVTAAGGRIIRAPAGSVQPLPVQDTSAGALSALEYLEQMKETRTGSTRASQGLSPDSLASASGYKVNQIVTASQKKILLIARIFAETGIKDLMLGIHRDLRRGPIKRIAMKLRGKWIPVNPRTWKDRTDMTVSVGLGTGNRDRQYAHLGELLMQQKEGMQAGLMDYRHLHATMEKMLEIAGFKNTQQFLPDPMEIEQKQAQAAQNQKPDPATLIAQAEMMKAQAEAQKAQFDAQVKQAELQLRQMDLQLKKSGGDTDRLKVMTDEDLRRDKLEQEAQQHRDRMALEWAKARATG